MDNIIFTNDFDVKKVCLAAFPGYKGRKFSVNVVNHPFDVRSYWDGGSRDYFNFVRIDTLKVMGEVPQQSMFDKPITNADKVELVPGLVCIRYTIFQGHDLGLTAMVHPDNAPKAIEDKRTELTDDELIVLSATCSLKSSYAGISNYRFVEAQRKTSITLDRWNKAKENLTNNKLLTKAGAITNEGKNILGNKMW